MVRSDFSGRETSDFRCTQSRFYRDTNHLWSGVCIIGFSLDPKDSENCTQSPFDLNKGLSVCLSKQRNLSAGVSRSKPYALDLGGNPDWVETASGWLTVMRKIRRRRVLRMIFGPPCDQFFFLKFRDRSLNPQALVASTSRKAPIEPDWMQSFLHLQSTQN